MSNRAKKVKPVKPFKGKKPHARAQSGTSNVPTIEKDSMGRVRSEENRAKIEEETLADRAQAAHKLATRTLGTNELAALMQEAPGGARPDQIKVHSRQFKKLVNDAPDAGATRESDIR